MGQKAKPRIFQSNFVAMVSKYVQINDDYLEQQFCVEAVQATVCNNFCCDMFINKIFMTLYVFIPIVYIRYTYVYKELSYRPL